MNKLAVWPFLPGWLCVFAILSSPLGAQTPLPFDELGAGPKAAAMGQAFTALADDPSAAYYNPAGLTQIRSPTYLTLGYVYAKPRVKVRFAEEPVPNPYLGRAEFSSVEDLSSHGLYVGFLSNFADVSAFRESAIASRFTIGICLFANLPQVNQFDNPQRPQDPYLFRYNERWSLVSMAISCGIKCFEWLSVGGGILPRVDSYQDSAGSWIILNPPPEDVSQGFRLDLRQETRISVVPIGGMQVKPPIKDLRERLSVGVCYRGQMWGFYGTGPTGVDVLIRRHGQDPIVIFSDPGGRTVDYIGFNPAQLSLGIAGKPLAGLTVSFDATLKLWSAFHFFWDVPPFDEIFYTDPNTGEISAVQVDTPFNDVWVWRIGGEYAFDPKLPWSFLKKMRQIALRIGYYREDTPVPYPMSGHPVFNMNGIMNILDANQNVISCGFGLGYDAEWTGVVKLEAYFQAHLLERNILTNDHDPNFGPISVGGEVYNFGIALSIVY